jgi:phosphoribosyl 1,2-cyclic phosphodiesterase
MDGDAAPTLLLDSGTGIRMVTALLDGGPFVGTVLLTHLHWDHFQGLPFFEGGDRPDSRVTLLLPDQEDGRGAEDVLGRGMSPPQFPIRPSQLRGRWTFDTLTPGHLDLDPVYGGVSHGSPAGGRGFSVDVREVPHKGGRTFGYRVGDGTSTVAYIPDHCPTEMGPGPDGWGEYHQSVMDLATGVDVLVHDAHLLPEELAAEAAFGHAAADYAVALGRRAGVGRVILFHHRPERTDEALDGLARWFQGAGVPVTVGAEGMVLDL